MNIPSLLGLVSTNVIFFLSVILALGGLSGFIDRNSILIVVGGSLSAILVSIPISEIKGAFKATKKWLFQNKKIEQAQLVQEIVGLAQSKRQGDAAFDQAAKNLTDPFLKDAASILFWADAEVSADEFRDLLETRSMTFYSANLGYSKFYKLASKFPPAFGMMGTVLGLIALLASLGGEGAKEKIGPAMAIALVTTLYGIAINNLFLIPVGESMEKFAKLDITNHNMTIEGLMLIQQKKPTKYIEEKLVSFLLPEERSIPNKKK